VAHEAQRPKKVHGNVEGINFHYKLDAEGKKTHVKVPSEHEWVRHMLRRKRGPVHVEWLGERCFHVKNDPKNVERPTTGFVPAPVDRLGVPIETADEE